MISTPGIYDIPAEAYHADCCPEPSLSSSIANILLSQSAAHAAFAHPKLNPAYEPEEDDRFDLGTAAHAYLLQGETGFVIIDAPDWRTKLAKEQRDAARAAGKVPLLAGRWADVQAMAAAARHQLEAFEESPRPLSGPGRAEQTLVWREGEIWCRARLDWLHDSHRFIDDYKTVGGTANPESWSRSLFTMGYDVQAAFYRRGLRALTGHDAIFRFVAQETFKPYALAVVALGPEAMELATKKVTHAIECWQHCLAASFWPAYPTRTAWADCPPWESARWLEREAGKPVPPPEDDKPLADLLFGEGGPYR